MLIVDMTEETRDGLLKDIKEIQSDIWDFRIKSIWKLEDYMDEIDNRLDTFIHDLEMELMEYEE